MKCKPYGQIVFLFCQQSHTYSSTDRCHMNVMKQGIAGSTYIPSICLVVLFWITYRYRIRYSVVNEFLFPRLLLYFLCWNSVVIFLFLSSWILAFSIVFFTPLHFLFLPHTVLIFSILHQTINYFSSSAFTSDVFIRHICRFFFTHTIAIFLWVCEGDQIQQYVFLCKLLCSPIFMQPTISAVLKKKYLNFVFLSSKNWHMHVSKKIILSH